MGNNLTTLLDNLLSGVPNLVAAILLAILTWIVAKVVKGIIIKIGKKTNLPKHFEKMRIVKDEAKGLELVKTLGSLGAFIVFLIMIPGVLEKLGMGSVAAPLSNMVSEGLAFIPNLIGAGIVLFVGYLISKIVKQIVSGLAHAFGADSLMKKITKNENTEEDTKFSELIGKIVFALIFIPTIILALDTLKLEAVSAPATMILETAFAMIPNIIVSFILIFVGVFIAKIVRDILEGLLNTAGVNNMCKNSNPDAFLSRNKLSFVIAESVKYLIIAIFAFEAVSVLNLAILTGISVTILQYMPNVFGALIVLVVAHIAAGFIAKLVEGATNSKFLAMTVKAIVYMFAIFMVLNQLAIATQIVNMAFLFILGAVSIAFILAFGLGGKDFAKNQLEKLQNKLK